MNSEVKYSANTTIFKFDEIHGIQEHRAKCVAVGPYERCQTLEFRDNDKWQVVNLMQFCFRLDITTFFYSMAQMENNLRNCYINDSFHLNSTELYEMMLLDGCFIIFALKCFARNRDPSEIGELLVSKSLNGHEATRLRKEACNIANVFKLHKRSLIDDFLLMDNQIPLVVLNELLTVCSGLRSFIGCKIEDLALSCFKEISPKMDNDKKKPRIEFLHLLDLFHWSRVPKDKYKTDDVSVPEPAAGKNSVLCLHSPQAVKLQELGLKFKKRKSASCLDIVIKESSCKKYSTVKIPKVDIDNFRLHLLQSLSTFELKYQKCGYCFTGFIECMTRLLQDEDDVKLLRKSGIIPKKAKATNEFVVRYFQDLTWGVKPVVSMPCPYEKYRSVVGDLCKKQTEDEQCEEQKKDRPKCFPFSLKFF